MPNPVDDAPVKPGEIALPSASDPSDQPTAALHPPAVGRPIDDLAHKPLVTSIADDSRLEPEDADYCAEWFQGAENLASASFELPAVADLLFFLSRGPVSGHIDVIQTPNYSRGPIEVNVTAQYHHGEDLERTKLCRMVPQTNMGFLFGFAEPRHPHGDPRQDIRFNITVALPSGVRNYKDITTDLARFSHSFDLPFDLWSPTSFEVIRLKVSNAAINFGLVGHSAFIQTSNAKAEGFFSGVELGVQTSNAPIEVTALMFGETTGAESRVQLKPPMGDGGKNSGFFLDASTSVGPAKVYLYSGFEGAYDLQTSLAEARIEETTDPSDPAGKGRLRTVTKTTTGKHAQGIIYWSEDGEPTEGVERGSVKVTTSVSPVELYI
ncbi:hypothetical protein B0H13DRAFT_2055043 [Mycena leptocephala]|nr:hypothetical protein B0H13DRAFT_2055043 [Mycena leptocephala]